MICRLSLSIKLICTLHSLETLLNDNKLTFFTRILKATLILSTSNGLKAGWTLISSWSQLTTCNSNAFSTFLSSNYHHPGTIAVNRTARWHSAKTRRKPPTRESVLDADGQYQSRTEAVRSYLLPSVVQRTRALHHTHVINHHFPFMSN